MNDTSQINLTAGWVGMLLGFLSGLGLGLRFHKAEWLGGYASLTRRMYRLAHISFFGIGAVNLLFYFSVPPLPLDAAGLLASRAFLLALPSMPIACVFMAHFPQTRPFFALPIVTLIAGAVLTLLKLSSL